MVKRVILKNPVKQDKPYIREIRHLTTGFDIFYGNEQQAMRFASRAAAIHVSRALKDYGNFYLFEEE